MECESRWLLRGVPKVMWRFRIMDILCFIWSEQHGCIFIPRCCQITSDSMVQNGLEDKKVAWADGWRYTT